MIQLGGKFLYNVLIGFITLMKCLLLRFKGSELRRRFGNFGNSALQIFFKNTSLLGFK